MPALADAPAAPCPDSDAGRPPPVLPPPVAAALWRGCDLGGAAGPVTGSGFDALDGELPGGGWPSRALTEVLCAQPGVLEWRLLGGALRRVVAAGRSVVLVGPPRHPHLPGLRHEGLDARHLVWIRAEAPSERLWCTELLVKSGASGAVVAWLPQARPEQVRRLQVCAQSCEGPVFLCRPLAARHEPSAAPLRVLAGLGPDWSLQVQLLKRRGAAHEGVLQLPSVPGGLALALTPRLMAPSRLIHERLTDRGAHAGLGRAAPARRSPARAH
ncbi:translesion DNA synthesis-associated protein ImuA [Aquincola sp. J276]|uniref:translesion DNA synthesis-associated protein ImuA n=1 Tax=Aquincola sp. J276 TaxID=2898432 RepID=UPI002151C3D1|nr:translesion DNA synthesis-associated protein ImuA [Aquincola sp. J276]MCR5867388.1 translesion DNA synthesis-associated protein ImuA [Aquincola sp. J276]